MNLKKITGFGLLLFVLILTSVNAGQFPKNMKVSEDGKQLQLRIENEEGFYDINELRTIYLEFEQTNWWQLLTQNYESKTDIVAKLTYEDEVFEGVGVRFRGQTSYFRVNGDKKSFNISLDHTDEEADIEGYQTFNLNNCYEDPSFMKEALFSNLAGYSIPTAKVNFIKLVINGEEWGVYANVQQLNGDFFEEWFQSNDGTRWRAEAPDTVTKTDGPGGPGGEPGGGGDNKFGAGTSTLNYLGEDYMTYTSHYTLKSTEEENPWLFLKESCRVLNESKGSDLYEDMKNYLDVDRALWHVANEIIFTDDDGYVSKGGMDYYVYYEPETGRITPIDYDGNSTFMNKGVSESIYNRVGEEDFPLCNVLISNPELKQRYLAHVRTIIAEKMIQDDVDALVDSYNVIIDQAVSDDDKKLYTYAQFVSGMNMLKLFNKNRKTFLLNQSDILNVGPEVSTVDFYSDDKAGKAPNPGQKIVIKANISSENGINEVRLYYSFGIANVFDKVNMYDDGDHNDGAAGDGVFAGEIPGFETVGYVRYYIEARADDEDNTASFSPPGAEHDVYFYYIEPTSAAESDVVINEFMASNKETIADPQGDYDDWIELYNKGTEDIDISGKYLSDKIDTLFKWQFPENTILKAGEYLVVWADKDEDDEPGIHTNFKLSAGGEMIVLIDSDANGNEILDKVEFGEQTDDISTGRLPNGTGDFFVMDPTPGAMNQSTGVEDELELPLTVYPNPSSDILNVETTATGSGFYKIIDLLGNTHLSGQIQNGSNQTQINIQNLNAGSYYLVWETSAGKKVTLIRVI
jgi:CotH protein/lamin tail-like protein/type IX secretion system substrate protein